MKTNIDSEKKDTLIILLLASFFSISFYLFYLNKGLILLYNDSVSHLNIARRVIDSLTPGIVQVGSNWLPLLHILEIPLIWFDPFWHSGFAGSIISIISFIVSSLMIYKIIFLITKNRWGSFLGTFVFTLNPNMLYLQGTAMFEPLMIVNYLFVIYFLLNWFYKKRLFDLLLSAFFLFLSTLTRYDGWFLLGLTTLVILFHTLKSYSRKVVEGVSILYIFIGSFGVFLWLIYNKLIFNNFFYFIQGPYSARAQQIYWSQLDKLPTQHNLFFSVYTYTIAIIYNIGIISFWLALIGLLYLLFKKGKFSLLTIFLLFSSFFFNILSLYLGQTLIWFPNIIPTINSFFNVRYGMLMLPSTAILIGILFSNVNKYFKIIIVSLLLIQLPLFYFARKEFNYKNLSILQDTVAGQRNSDHQTGEFLHNNCYNTKIFISAAGYEATVFNSKLSMNHFITEGTGKYWHTSLKKPSIYAGCIIMGNSFLEQLRTTLPKNQDFINNYSLIATFDTMSVYKKNSLLSQSEKKLAQKFVLTPTPIIAQNGNISVPQPTHQLQEPQQGKSTKYVVHEGDSLWQIAAQKYGDPYKWVDIAEKNNITNPDYIYPGQELDL